MKFYALVAIAILALVLPPIIEKIFRIESENKSKYEGQIVNSESLKQELKDEGSDIPAMNPACGCGFNNYARRDKSWSSLPDFFKKLFSGKYVDNNNK